MASISWLLRMPPTPLMPNPPAICLSSGRSMPESPAARRLAPPATGASALLGGVRGGGCFRHVRSFPRSGRTGSSRWPRSVWLRTPDLDPSANAPRDVAEQRVRERNARPRQSLVRRVVTHHDHRRTGSLALRAVRAANCRESPADPPLLRQADPGAVPVDGHGERRPALRAASGDFLLLARVREDQHGGTGPGHDRRQPVGAQHVRPGRGRRAWPAPDSSGGGGPRSPGAAARAGGRARRRAAPPVRRWRRRRRGRRLPAAGPVRRRSRPRSGGTNATTWTRGSTARVVARKSPPSR